MTAKELIEKLSGFDTDKDIIIKIGIGDERYGMGCMGVTEFEGNITLFPVRIEKWWIED